MRQSEYLPSRMLIACSQHVSFIYLIQILQNVPTADVCSTVLLRGQLGKSSVMRCKLYNYMMAQYPADSFEVQINMAMHLVHLYEHIPILGTSHNTVEHT